MDSYDHVVAFLYPGNNNAGAAGSDAIFDQSPYSLEFYQHEMGHVLGYSHAFGPQLDYEYEDGWCVMGHSLVQDHPVMVPPALAAVMVDNPTGFWRSGRRLSTAALLHYTGSTEFASTSSVLHLDISNAPQTIQLVAASESQLHDPSVALIGTELFQLTLELRIPTGGRRRHPAQRDNQSGGHRPLHRPTTAPAVGDHPERDLGRSGDSRSGQPGCVGHARLGKRSRRHPHRNTVRHHRPRERPGNSGSAPLA